MNKRIFLLALLVVANIAWPLSALADSYSDGVTAYKVKNYPKAASLLQKSLRENPGNADGVFYLGMAYTHLNNYEGARKAFETVIQMVPPGDPLAAKARNNMDYVTKQQITLASSSAKAAQVLNTSLSRASKPNYLTYAIPSGKVVHFSTARMPIKVYIDDGASLPGWNTEMKQSVTYAMRAWQSATGGKVSFVQTYTKSNADIMVTWQKTFDEGKIGVSPWQTIGDTIIRSDVILSTLNPQTGKAFSLDALKQVAMHEMGHAIGIKGHSPYPEDIMFWSKTYDRTTLSQRDITTIGMLYKLEADIQNNAGMSTAMTQKYFQLYESGRKAQIEHRVADAIAYYRQALAISRALPEAKFNLGALLINEGKKMYDQGGLTGAKRNFEEAVQLYSEIMQMSQPPAYAKDNLEVARGNLALVNASLK